MSRLLSSWYVWASFLGKNFHHFNGFSDEEMSSSSFLEKITAKFCRLTLMTHFIARFCRQINSILILPIVREIYKKATSMPSPSPYGLQRPQLQQKTRLQHSDSRLSTKSELPQPSSPKDHLHQQHPLDNSHANSLKLKGTTTEDSVSPRLPQNKRKSLLMFHFHSKSQDSNGTPDHSSLKKKDVVTVVPSGETPADKLLIDSRADSRADSPTHRETATRASQPYFKTASSSLSKASFLVSLRAATLLLPLYGLHYLVIVYRPDVE